MIPKLIHHIWIGNNNLPEEFKKFLSGWKEVYYDFEFIFWDNKKIDLELIVDDTISKYYYGNYKLAFKCDLLRFKILEKYGGIYIDVDTECLRKMPEHFFDYNFFSGYQPNNEIAIGIMGSSKNEKLVKQFNNDVLENINKNYNTNFDNLLHEVSGPAFFTKIAKQYESDSNYKFFEPNYFYPYGWWEMQRRNENFKVTCPDAYSVHHWAHSWW